MKTKINKIKTDPQAGFDSGIIRHRLENNYAFHFEADKRLKISARQLETAGVTNLHAFN